MPTDLSLLSTLLDAGAELPSAFTWSVLLADSPATAETFDNPSALLGTIWRRAIDWQMRLSAVVDRLLPARYRVYGRQYFRESLVPRYLAHGLTIYDVGGGANPFLSVAEKQRLGARVVGLDISADELANAPEDSYDSYECADIASFRGVGDADLVICQSVLEHVRDVRGAFYNLAGILRPGGRMLLFVPNRNALFARLNLLLPERLKRALLFTIYPAKRYTSGFPAFYDRCTPREFRELAAECGLTVEFEEHFFISSYFFAIFPAYLLWRAWILAASGLFGGQAAATFCMVLRKPEV